MPVLLLTAALLPAAPLPAEEARGLFYPSRLEIAAGGYTHPTQFAAAGVCAGCHAEIVGQWDGSMHSRAHPDPLYLALSRLASRETGGLTDRFCAGCHTPLAVASAEVPPVGNPLMSRQGIEGVTCDFCHVVQKSTGTGNLPAILDPGPDKRGPRNDAVSPFHATSFLELSTQAEFCGLCHDVSHPLNDLPIEHTYSEWKGGPYNNPDPSLRVYCQDCHMRQQPGKPATGQTDRPNTRGKAAAMGPWRENVYSHWFVGGNAAMNARLGPTVHRELARERLQNAAMLEVIDARQEGGTLRFSVRVTNSGAGHNLPTGLTEARQMWLETTLRAPDGKVLHARGGLDARGEIAPDTAVWHTVLGNSAGAPTVKVWEADRVLSDHRIPPLQHDDVPFEIRLGDKAGGPFTLTARLLYRSFPPALAGLFPEASIGQAAPVEMAVVEAVLPGGGQPPSGGRP